MYYYRRILRKTKVGLIVHIIPQVLQYLIIKNGNHYLRWIEIDKKRKIFIKILQREIIMKKLIKLILIVH